MRVEFDNTHDIVDLKLKDSDDNLICEEDDYQTGAEVALTFSTPEAAGDIYRLELSPWIDPLPGPGPGNITNIEFTG